MTEVEAIDDPIDVLVQVVRTDPTQVRVWAPDGSGHFVAPRSDRRFALVTARDQAPARTRRRSTTVASWPVHSLRMSRSDFDDSRDSR